MRTSRRSTGRPAAPAAPAKNLPVVQPHAAALDIGAELIHAALPPDRDPQPVRVFRTFTADLQALAAWLVAHQITTVALEATGVFWIPVFQILEQAGLEVCLVNARHVKNVRGRKTDIQDCQWLQQLHAAGLLHASFRPPDAICAVRAILRYRETLVTQGATQIQHMHKALTQMNLQLHHVLTDITGVSGLRILDALLAGERDPTKLAALREKKVKASAETVAAALVGDWRPEHLFVLRQARENYAYFQTKLGECDREIERLLAALDGQADPQDAPPPPANAPKGKGRKNQIRLPTTDLRTELFRLLGTDVTQCPGLGPATVAKVVGELGTDLRAFPTQKRFCSWLGGCPDPIKTGGRKLRDQTRGVKHRVMQAFREAAQSLHASNTALGRFYRRLKARHGPLVAVAATAHKLARIFYHLVTTKDAYDEQVFAHAEREDEVRRIQSLYKRARALGLKLVPATDVS